MEKIDLAFEKIGKCVGERYVARDDFVLQSYSRNSLDGAMAEVWPDLVVRPNTTQEISEILKIANELHIPIWTRGAGTDPSSGAKPVVPGGLVIDMTRMKRILDIDESNRVVTVECGISWGELNSILFPKGLYTGTMGPMSGPVATIGGGLSNHSIGGGGCFKYGECSGHCIALEVVLPTGEVIYTGGKSSIYVERPFARWVNGPDYTGLFLGDAGIHGIKTRATLHIFKRPRHRLWKTLLVPEPQPIERVAKIMNECQKEGDLGIYDLICFSPDYTALISSESGAVLAYLLEGESERGISDNAKLLDEIAADFGANPFEDNMICKMWERHPDGLMNWQTTGFLFNILKNLFGPATDGFLGCCKVATLQIPKFTDAISHFSEEYKEEFAEKIGVNFSTFVGFVATKNYVDTAALILTYDLPQKKEASYRLWKRLLKTMIKGGGMPYWMGHVYSQSMVEAGAYTDQTYNFMKSIKGALDPNGICNPGKFHLSEEAF